MSTFLRYLGDSRFPGRLGRIDGIPQPFEVGDELLIDEARLIAFSRPTGEGMEKEFAEMVAGALSANLPSPAWEVIERPDPSEDAEATEPSATASVADTPTPVAPAPAFSAPAVDTEPDHEDHETGDDADKE